mgnify:CR=1 FL=1
MKGWFNLMLNDSKSHFFTTQFCNRIDKANGLYRVRADFVFTLKRLFLE